MTDDSYSVLVPVGADEDEAVRQAEFVTGLPRANEAMTVSVLFVFTDESWPKPIPDELKQFDSADRVTSVRRLVERLDDAGIEHDLIEESGNVTEDIVRVADDVAADLIVMGGRKRSRAGKMLFGSTTQSVLFETDYPVAIVGGE